MVIQDYQYAGNSSASDQRTPTEHSQTAQRDPAFDLGPKGLANAAAARRPATRPDQALWREQADETSAACREAPGIGIEVALFYRCT